MIKIDLLKNHPNFIPEIAHIWHEVLGRIWIPDMSVEEIASWYYEDLNDAMPLAYIALYKDMPVGSCTLQLNDGIRPDLSPWLGDLVVDSKYQKQGIGKMLVDIAMKKAKELGFKKLYLFAFDPTIPAYYQRLGWEKIGMDEFKSHPVTVMAIGL
jgi:GNAT superfamily N-acetyltransferase